MLRIKLASRWAWAWVAGTVLVSPAAAQQSAAPKAYPAASPYAPLPAAAPAAPPEAPVLSAPAVPDFVVMPTQAQQPGAVGTPGLLPRPGGEPAAPGARPEPAVPEPDPNAPLFDANVHPPLGFPGRSGILPRNYQVDNDFVPKEDRWRIGFVPYDRYGRGHPLIEDYPYEYGSIYDPYQQNVLKGDFPIYGQHTFLKLTATSLLNVIGRAIPTAASGGFESTARPFFFDFFGSPNQLINNQQVRFEIDLNHGDAAFKPTDWRVKLTPVFNLNTLNVDELAVVNPDVRRGVTRDRTFLALEEYFVESKITDLSPYYDFMSVRVGTQPFVSDFRGFIFADINRGLRLFGTLNSQRLIYNIVLFDQLEKNTNSGLNTFDDRTQQVAIANLFIQDFIFPGFQILPSFHFNHDSPSVKFNTNTFRVRPDNAGNNQPHGIDVAYLGLGSNGHIGRYNITSQYYFAFGRDSDNPIANTGQDIKSNFFALELSYDRDYVRFRVGYLYSQGDSNPNNGTATGFDAILENQVFGGGEFSYWQRNNIPLFNVNLVNDATFIPDLSSSRIQGQANFVNPGIQVFNLGLDVDLTPKLKAIFNTNFLGFDKTAVLETFLFDGNIDRFIGTDISLGLEYRPLLSNNVFFTFGANTLIPGSGLKDLLSELFVNVDPLASAFMTVQLQY